MVTPRDIFEMGGILFGFSGIIPARVNFYAEESCKHRVVYNGLLWAYVAYCSVLKFWGKEFFGDVNVC